MTPKPDVDPEFLSSPKSRPSHRSVRLLGRLMTLVALSGLALAAYSGQSRPNWSRFGVRNRMLGQGTPGFLPQLQEMPCLRGPFGHRGTTRDRRGHDRDSSALALMKR